MHQTSRLIALVVIIIIVILVGMWIFNQKYKTQEERDANMNQLWIGLAIAIGVILVLYYLMGRGANGGDNMEEEKKERRSYRSGQEALSMESQPTDRFGRKIEPMSLGVDKYSLNMNSGDVSEDFASEQFGVISSAKENWRNMRAEKAAGEKAAARAEAEAVSRDRNIGKGEIKRIRAEASERAKQQFKKERREVKEAGREGVAEREAAKRAEIAGRKKAAEGSR